MHPSFNNNFPILSLIIGWLFDTSMGPPGPSGHWPLWLTVVFRGSNLASGLMLVSFPLLIIGVWRNRRGGVSSFKFWLVCSFLPVLGLSRLVRACDFWGPPYHLITLVEMAVTCVIGVAFCVVRPFSQKVLYLPSRAEMHDVKGKLNIATLEVWFLKRDRDGRVAELAARVEAALVPAREEDRERRLVALESLADEMHEEPT